MSNKSDTFDAMYLREYRKRNPEKSEQWRINAEIRHLEQCGYTVVPQRKPPEEMTVDELESYLLRQKATQKRWKSEHREHLREYHKKYMREHPEARTKTPPEKQRIYQARWREKNREAIREKAKEYRKAHPDRIREAQARWKKKNPHYGKLRLDRYKAALEAKRKQEGSDSK